MCKYIHCGGLGHGERSALNVFFPIAGQSALSTHSKSWMLDTTVCMCRIDDCWGLGDGERAAVSVVAAP